MEGTAHSAYKEAASDKGAVERFWERVDKTDDGGCWLWTGRRLTKGYGRFFFRGRSLPATRMAIYLHSGRELAEGEIACHHCDNPPCVNPAHLFVGTDADNKRDCAQKGRFFKWRGRRSGSANPRSKLTEATARMIRADQRTHALIAKEYGVSRTTVSQIKSRKVWSHIP